MAHVKVIPYFRAMSQEEKAPEPVYHFSDNFSTAYFGKLPDDLTKGENPSSDQKLISNFIGLLTNPANREEKLEALNIIRNAKAQQFLVDLIAMPRYEKQQKELVMACWESGMDFSAHLIFFAGLVVNCEYPVALEAITVIDEMHALSDKRELEEAINLLSSDTLDADKQKLALQTIAHLKSLAG